MTIDQRNWPALQHVSCPTAKASTSELHTICLAQSNHELTLLHEVTAWQPRMNTNSCSRGRRPRPRIIGELGVERFPLVNFYFFLLNARFSLKVEEPRSAWAWA